MHNTYLFILKKQHKIFKKNEPVSSPGIPLSSGALCPALNCTYPTSLVGAVFPWLFRLSKIINKRKRKRKATNFGDHSNAPCDDGRLRLGAAHSPEARRDENRARW
jgi:hypothetical protein